MRPRTSRSWEPCWDRPPRPLQGGRALLRPELQLHTQNRGGTDPVVQASPSLVRGQGSPSPRQRSVPVMDHEPRLTLPERRPHLRANLSVLRVPARDSGLTLAASVLGPQPRDEGQYGGGQCFSLGLGACNEILPLFPTPSAVFPQTTALNFLSPSVQWTS